MHLLGIVLFSLATSASDFRYTDCALLRESRVSLRGNTVCVQELRCRVRLAGVPQRPWALKTAYCRPDTLSGRCPDSGEECIADGSVSSLDLDQIHRKLVEGHVEETNCLPASERLRGRHQ